MNKRHDPFSEGERRQATILFADLSGFTSMSEKMDPEELTSLINECLKIMGSSIEEHEGTIDKFMGDCVMALFGVPAMIENAPLKAINAAIEIRNRINHFTQSKEFKYPLDIHIGINTGMVIAGPVGTGGIKDYTVMGNTVNVASRLKDISTAGQIFVGKNTYHYTKDNFQYKVLEPILIKGKEETVAVFELLSQKERVDRKGWRSDRMVSSEMVGRNKEMDKLSLHLLKVINGEGSIVNVIGEAGIGKSRLMAEIRNKEEISRVTFLEGRAISSGKNLSFHPIIDILKKWSGINEDDTDHSIGLKLEKKIHMVVPDEISEIFPFIATLMGLKLSGKYADRVHGIEGVALEKLILKNMDTLLTRMASIQPLMVVLEDMHWADLTSIEMLESLYRLAENNSILFVNIFRPGYSETSERILQTIQNRYTANSINIRLEPLSMEDCENLINNLLRIKGFPIEVKDQIVKRASGNPFFIEEIIRSFIDDGIILIRNNNFEVTRKIDSVVIPGSINEVIMARIDRLDESARSLLKIASVIGRSFYYKILTQMTELEEEVDSRLALMVEIQLISRQHNREEVAYLFKHALAQQATYESILLKQRKELHLKTAQTIEKIFADKITDFYGILAWHYSKGEDFKKAEEYLVKAGEEALRTSASSEAINYFREGLKIYRSQYGKAADLQKVAEMEKNIGSALLNKGQFGEAIRYFDNVLKYYGIKTHKNKLGTLVTVISGFIHLLIALYLPSLKWRKIPTPEENKLHWLMYQQFHCLGFVESHRMLFCAFQLIKKLTNFDLSSSENGVNQFIMATYIFSYAGVSFKLSRKILSFLEAKVKKDDAIERMTFVTSQCLNNRMEGNYVSHVFDSALVEESFRIGNLQLTSYYIIFSFFIDLGQGKFIEARQKIEKLQEMREIFDNYTVEGWVFIAKSKLLTKQRKLREALIQVEKFIEFCKKVDDKSQLFWGYATIAYIEILMEDPIGADQSLQHIPQNAQKDMLLVFKTTLMVSQLSVHLYYLERAIFGNNSSNRSVLEKKIHKICKEAVGVATKIADDRVELLKLTGTYYWLIGKQKKAIKWWGKSIIAGEKLGALPELARTYLEIGKRLKEPESRYYQISGLQADGCLEKADQLLKELNAYTEKLVLS